MSRPRLLRSLAGLATEVSAPSSVVLVSAPAGYGKTTLLATAAQELRSAGCAVAWVTCEPDEDTTTFWPALISSLRSALDASTADRVLDALAGLEPPEARTNRDFIGPLMACVDLFPPVTVIIVDDVHHLQDRTALDGLSQIIDSAPKGVHFVLGCRRDPKVGIARWRVSERLREIRVADLSFTPDEANEFWRQRDAAFDETRAMQIWERTEGWAAGLQLAALSIGSSEDSAEFVADFLANDRVVEEYLTAEVLARVPDAWREFMLSTSVVDSVCGDLANRLTGRDDGGAMLAQLEHQNLLVVRLGRTGRWYRYHELLRRYLRAELDRRSPERLRALTSDAARWYRDQGRYGEALGLAAQAHDTALTADLLHSHGLPLLLAGSLGPVRRAIASASGERARAPVLLVHRALAALEVGDLLDADAALDGIDPRSLDLQADERLSSLYLLAQMQRSRLAADLGSASESDLLASRLDLDPSPGGARRVLDEDVRLVALANRGALRLFAGDHLGAQDDLVRGAQLARSTGLNHLALYCLSLVPGSYTAASQFALTRQSAEEAIAFAADRGWSRSARLAYPYALAAWMASLMLDPEAAAARAAEALDVLDEIDTAVDAEAEGAARSAEAVIAFDHPRKRWAALGRLQETTELLSPNAVSPPLIAIPAEHEVRMCLTLGQWQMAERTVSRAREKLGDTGDVAVMQAQLAHHRGRDSDARRHLQPVLAGDLVPISSTATTTAWLVEALTAKRAGHAVGVDRALRAAMSHASPTQAIRPFFDAGSQMRAPLASMRGRAGHDEDFLDSVCAGLARMDAWQAHMGAGSASMGGLDGAPLSVRELEVLRELPSMRTLSEIAATQSVSTNTVKTHVKSIYSKLGARSRREAIATARARSLL
ncbi:MAG: LuxR C-terminal-related transcriptional regulator [Deinococcales bacterium]